jgi:hypothetical protein
VEQITSSPAQPVPQNQVQCGGAAETPTATPIRWANCRSKLCGPPRNPVLGKHLVIYEGHDPTWGNNQVAGHQDVPRSGFIQTI